MTVSRSIFDASGSRQADVSRVTGLRHGFISELESNKKEPCAGYAYEVVDGTAGVCGFITQVGVKRFVGRIEYQMSKEKRYSRRLECRARDF